MNPELYQKLDFMVFRFVNSNLSATTAKNCAVNKHQAGVQNYANCDYFVSMNSKEKKISKTISRKESRICSV